MSRSYPQYLSSHTGTTLDAPPADDRWALSLSLCAIVLSLVLLVIVPVLVERHIARLRTDRVEVVAIAERESNQLAFALAREMALLRGFVTDRDPGLVRAYWEMRTRENEALQHIGALESRLPEPAVIEWREVNEFAVRWHESVEPELRAAMLDGLAPGSVEPSLGRPLYERTLDALGELRDSLAVAREDVRREIVMAERYGLAATTGLALLALVATLLVVWLGRRVRRYAERARRAHAEAVRANEARTRLMRGFTHDLKNPLSVVTLSAELLRTGVHGELTEEQERIVERLKRSVEHGLEVIDDLSELAQAEAGQIEIAQDPLDLKELLQTVWDEYSAPAAAAGLSLRLQSRDSTSTVLADGGRVRQILGNLVGNAINYTPDGGTVTLGAVSVAAGPDGHPGSWVAISVEDTGRGIPRDQVGHVFEEFVRLPGVVGRRRGTGIGLAISRQLARLMGGEITLESEEGRGSTFTFWLPLTSLAATSPIDGDSGASRPA